MWKPWLKSSGSIHSANPYPYSYPPSSPIHRHSSSFKDIHSLLSDDPISSSPSIFHRVFSLRFWAHRPARAHSPPDSHNRVVVYFTSLRVVRKTFEDCRAVRSILKSYGVKIDERDLSMDSSFREEILQIGKMEGGDLELPRVYIDGKYVGGAEEIRRLQESGELRWMIQGLERADVGVCRGCGGHRFVVCERCGGSHKVHVAKIGVKSCTWCNESGLIRCSKCTSVSFC